MTARPWIILSVLLFLATSPDVPQTFEVDKHLLKFIYNFDTPFAPFSVSIMGTELRRMLHGALYLGSGGIFDLEAFNL